MRNSKTLVGIAVLASSWVGACGSESASCVGDAVAVQMFNNTPMAVNATATLVDTECIGSGVIPAQDPVPTDLFDEDLRAGQRIEFQVEGGPSVRCTVDQEGVDITYVRAEYDFLGMLQCSCGFAEYYEDSANRGSCV